MSVHAELLAIARSVAELREEPVTDPPEGLPVVTYRPGCSPLIGLTRDRLDELARAGPDNLDSFAVPRQPKLTERQRDLEARFVELFAAEPVGTVARYRQHVGDSQIYEVDLAKRCMPDWGRGARPATEAEKYARSLGNIALHTLAQVITALAVLQRLDELAALADDDPAKHALCTMGPVAAGKGQLINLLKAAGKFHFGAVFDAAGEGHALDANWFFDECQMRGIPAMFGYCSNEAQVKGLLDRGVATGRLPDAMTFSASYAESAKNARAFFERPGVLAGQRDGSVEVFGYHLGPFNKRSLTDPSLSPFPNARALDADERGALRIPAAREPAEIVEEVLRGVARAADLPAHLRDAALIGLVLWPDIVSDWLSSELKAILRIGNAS
jgi:hypothetical protein